MKAAPSGATPGRKRTLRRQRSEASRLWISAIPRDWPLPKLPWTDLAGRTVGRWDSEASGDEEPTGLAIEGHPGRVYLPPGAAGQGPTGQGPTGHGAGAAGVRRTVLEAGGAILSQITSTRAASRGDESCEEVVLDLLPHCLGLSTDADVVLEGPCEFAVWPLIPGLTSDEDKARGWLESLRHAGFSRILPVALGLDARQRRSLAEFADESGYRELFHGELADERQAARQVARHGLRPFARPPRYGGSRRQRFGFGAAAVLEQVGDLWLRNSRSEVIGQELLRAARFCRRDEHDLRALIREGNLDIVPWLAAEAREVLEELGKGEPPALQRELEEEYLAP